MSNRYGLAFTSGDPRTLSGLTPTFLIYKDQSGNDITPTPTVTEVGTSTGLYYFQATPSPTLTYFFLVDGGAAAASSRYLTGTIDPIANVDQELGFTMSSFGTTVNPSSVFGLAKRIVELFQADATFNKNTGAWSNYAKGTSTLLMEKTLTNSVTETTKT